MEAEKATLKEQNKTLEVTVEAAKAEAARVAAEEDADAGGSSKGSSGSRSAADAIAKAMKSSKKAKLHEQCTFPHSITYPEWPTFDPSVKFDKTDPLYVDGHMSARWHGAKCGRPSRSTSRPLETGTPTLSTTRS